MATNETQIANDGDAWFLGYASRLDPSNLPEKTLQESSNMRLQRGTGTIRLGAQRLNGYLTDNRIGEVHSTTTYTDPSTGYEYILMVLGGGILLCYQDGTTYKYINFIYSTNVNPATAAYPSINLGDEVQAIQALNKVYILRGAATTPAAAVTFTNAAIPNNTWGTFVVTGFPFRKWLNLPYTADLMENECTITIPRDHGFEVGDVLQVFSPVPFGTKIIEITNTTIKIAPAIALPTSTGTISFMLSSDIYGTEFIVQSTHQSHFNGTYPVQNTATITTTGVLTFHYFNNTGQNINPNTNASGMTLLQAKSPIVWDGVSATASPVNQTTVMTGTTAQIPPADFGIYFQNRLVLKTSDHYIAVSDILSDTFDMQLNNFNINLGSGDDIIGFLPWIQDQFLVFMRRAIYVAFVETTSYISGPPGVNSSITVVTSEIGCLSRRSIVNAGQFVFFLSSKGVHMLTPQLDLKLLGNTQPLSEPIADLFERLNYNVSNHCAAAYHANRFYLSLPIDGSRYNNRVVVYNTLNAQWESLDEYPSTMHVDEWFTCAYGTERRLMAGCRIWSGWITGDAIDIALSAGVALFEQVQDFDEWEYVYIDPNYEILATPIVGSMRTREYAFNAVDGKRFTRAQIQFDNPAGSNVQIFANTHDPDVTEMILDYTFETSGDATLRPRIGSRGAAIDIRVNILSGSPFVKTIQVSAFTADRPMISQE
jgi:hypothetical protein